MSDQKLKAEHFTRKPLADIAKPRTGLRCLADCWWAITEDDEALFFHGPGRKNRSGSPQYNSDRRVVEHIIGLYDFPARAVLVPMAFLPCN